VKGRGVTNPTHRARRDANVGVERNSRRDVRRVARSALVWLAVLAMMLLFLGPVWWMVAASFKPDDAIHADVGRLGSFLPQPFTVEHYVEAAGRGGVGTTMLNTVIVVAVIALGGLLINAPAAYAFARMKFPGRDLLFLLLVATIIVPIEVIVIPLFLLVQPTRGIAEVVGERPWTLAALSIPFVAKAVNIFLLRQSFLAMPRSLEEAAFLDGASWWTVFWRVAIPNNIPALVTVALLDFVTHWNDFLWPLVVSQGEHTRTIQLGLGNFFTQPPISWGAILAYAVIATIPMVIAFAVGQRWIVESLASTSVKE